MKPCCGGVSAGNFNISFQRTVLVAKSAPMVSLFNNIGLNVRVSEDSMGEVSPLGLTRLRAALDLDAKNPTTATIVADFIMGEYLLRASNRNCCVMPNTGQSGGKLEKGCGGKYL